MSRSQSTVYLVDDDASIRSSLERFFKFEGLNVENFSSAEDFLKQASCKRPGCIISDIYMPGLSGLDLQEMCDKRGIHLPILFITGYGKVPVSVQAMKKGAVDFLTKPYDEKQLLQVVKNALEKDRQALESESSISKVQRRVEELSERERQVLEGVLSGLLNKQIAVKMKIVEQTVKAHRANVMRKMKANSIPHLVKLAVAAGISSTEN